MVCNGVVVSRAYLGLVLGGAGCMTGGIDGFCNARRLYVVMLYILHPTQ